jgi:hypothetical protein
MPVAKFLQIYDKVKGMIRLNPGSEIRVEYGDENFFPSLYHVGSVEVDRASLRARLEPPATTCKARDRREIAGEGETCCASGICCAA